MKARAPALRSLDVVMNVECPECGGFAIPLDTPQRAHTVRRQLERSACPGCITMEWRAGRVRGVLPDMWWDAVTWEWMVTVPVGEHGTATMPTGIRGYWARAEANAAALALVDPAGQPIAISETGRPRERDQLTLFYESERWRLAVPCFDCGGFELPLRSRRPSGVHRALAEARDALAAIAHDCPGCVARSEREAAQLDDAEPRLWFDPAVGDWVISQPVDGMGPVTLPLGIGRLDPEPWVLENAAMRVLGQPDDDLLA